MDEAGESWVPFQNKSMKDEGWWRMKDDGPVDLPAQVLLPPPWTSFVTSWRLRCRVCSFPGAAGLTRRWVAWGDLVGLGSWLRSCWVGLPSLDSDHLVSEWMCQFPSEGIIAPSYWCFSSTTMFALGYPWGSPFVSLEMINKGWVRTGSNGIACLRFTVIYGWLFLWISSFHQSPHTCWPQTIIAIMEYEG